MGKVRRAIDATAERLSEEVEKFEFLTRYFNSETVLVPMPRSSLLQPDALWSPKEICESILRQGLADSVVPCVRRVKAVKKAATARSHERTNPPEHYASVRVDANKVLFPPKRITLVDDVVTRGSSFVGIYPRLQEAFPGVPIGCFGLIRTMSGGVEIDRISNPVIGKIFYNERTNSLNRSP